MSIINKNFCVPIKILGFFQIKRILNNNNYVECGQHKQLKNSILFESSSDFFIVLYKKHLYFYIAINDDTGKILISNISLESITEDSINDSLYDLYASFLSTKPSIIGF